MKIEKMYIGKNKDIETYQLTADEGKVLKRVDEDNSYTSSVILGYVYYKNGEKLAEPYFEKPEDYEEVDEPKEDVPTEPNSSESTDNVEDVEWEKIEETSTNN